MQAWLMKFEELTDQHLKKFYSLFEKTDSNKCWIWRGRKTVAGYGQPVFNGKSLYAHRISFWLANKIDPGKLSVCHKCDNPICINPDHLFLGTHSDNMQDCVAKGRAFRNPVRGSRNNKAKITEADVIKIRDLRKNGIKTGVIEKMFGLKRSAIWSIYKRKTWNHI